MGKSWAGCVTAAIAVAGFASVAIPVTAGADVDAAGVLRIATNLDQFDWEIDEVDGFGSASHFGIVYHVIGTPLRLAPDGTYEPYLAESFEVVDGSTVRLVLRDGLTFHDGTPYDAQTLADGIRGYQTIESQAFQPYSLHELASIDVESPTELTFHLSAPVAGLFVDALANAPAAILAPGSTPAAPIGAGPFRVTEYTELDHLVAERWDDFFAADDYPLGGVEWLHIPQIEAAQNALQAGQVDLIATNPRDLDALLQQGPFAATVTNNQGHQMLALCKAAAPFDDPVFREAFDLAVNREQLNLVVYGGNAQALESVLNPGSPLAVAGLLDTEGDQERARELLDEIGWDSGDTVTLGVYPGFQTQELVAESLVAQLAEVGINLELTFMEGFVFSDYVNPEAGGAVVIANVNAGVQAIEVPGEPPASHWNPCADSDPDLAALLEPLVDGSGATDDQAAAWAAVQEYVVDKHLWIPLVTQPAAYVYDTERVQGVGEGTVGLTGSTMPSPFLAGISIIDG